MTRVIPNPSATSNGQFLNARQVAELLGVSLRSVRKYSACGLLPMIKLGRRRVYSREALVASLMHFQDGGAA